MIGKQKKTIIIGAIVFVVLILSYFFIVRPLLVEEEPEEEIPELLEGERLGTNNRILMFEHCEKADIKSIQVHNKKGEYTFIRALDDNFYIKGKEAAPYSKEALSYLVVSAGYTLSLRRITTDCQNMHDYGLAPEDDPSWYIVTRNDGTEHKVWIGNAIITGGGYYARYEGRNAVYVLDESIAQTLLADINYLITPVLAYPISTTDSYTTDDFYIVKEGKLFVQIDYQTNEEKPTDAGLGSFRMLYPTNYNLNSDNYTAILAEFEQFYGTGTVEVCETLGGDFWEIFSNPDAEVPEFDAESAVAETFARLKEKYGIDMECPYRLIHYHYHDMDTTIVFSEPDENGNMYAYSSLYDLVAQIPTSTAYFLDWDIIKFVDHPVYMENINDVAKIEVKSPDVNVTFTLTGEGTDIIIKSDRSDKAFDSTAVKNFRQWYRLLLSINMEDYAEQTDISEMDFMTTVTITFDNGDVTELSFYSYSTRRAFYTVNGNGEFYVIKTSVEKLLDNAIRVINGDAVNADF